MGEEEKLHGVPGDSDNRATVEGQQLAPADTGFGQLWDKRLSVVIEADTGPEGVMTLWRERLHLLWPDAGELYRSPRGIREGELVGLDLGVGPAKLSTGALVTQWSPTSFTLAPPQGHMFAGFNRFETEDVEPGSVRASVWIRIRASDPLYELGLLFGGHRFEERFWAQMLWNLAAEFGQRPKVRLRRRLIGRRRKWRNAGNIRHNAGIRTSLRRLRRLVGEGEPG